MELWFICSLLGSFLLLIYLGIVIYTNCNTNEHLIMNIQKNHTQNGSKYIPKKIHQILIRDKEEIPPSFAKNIEFLKKLNPGWSHTLYNEKDIIEFLKKNYPPYILSVYKKINPEYAAAKADFFRYLLIYKEGGVYLDIKSSMKIPLDNIIREDDEYILSHWLCPCNRTILNSEFGEFQQWHIISRPGHPYLKSVIENVIKNIENYDKDIDGVGKIGVLRVTGPLVYTDSIMPILKDHKHTIYEASEYVGLIYNITSYKDKFTKKHYSELDSSIIIND